METEKQTENKKKRMDEKDWKWLTAILIGVIILILTLRLGDNLEVINLFSFISSAASIVLALVAINISLKQDSDNRVVNENVKSILHGIVSDVGIVKTSVEKITGNDIDTIAQDTLETITAMDEQPTYSAEEAKELVQEAINNFSENVKTKVEKVGNNNSLYNGLKNYIEVMNKINEILNEENGEFKSTKYIQSELLKRHGIALTTSEVMKVMSNRF
ncbi:hypothetical protein FC756_14510 [Lysinibacillus mangiferihumi]|uniref:Uncharacterized protein n=1 Tax=Lysinibacillus mangiferihumi TaxID=1130819 RepID=A0A4U2YZH5_9BACI|nr:hypothetical protein [Lysinibacillus mangiferihumi]TKI66635.1 hypothetical protein FC756_14510 [Lysinibacillus mangiferihumi]